MELVYHLETHDMTKREWMIEDKSYLSVSNRNTVAFSASSASRNSESILQREYTVYASDLDKPWDAHKVITLPNRIVGLKWDVKGTRLLVSDADGHCHVCCMKDNLLNRWECFGKTELPSEEILTQCWFHTGVLVNLNIEKKDNVLYTDKFSRVRFSSSVFKMGGKAVDGFIAISSTGLVTAGLMEMMEEKLMTAQESLAPCHLRISLVDVAHRPNGEFLVAVTDGLVTASIQCFSIALKVNNSMCQISCHAQASLYVKGSGDTTLKDSRVTHLKFASPENSDTLLVAHGNHSSSCVEIWQLIEQNFTLHKMFQGNTKTDSALANAKWMHKASISHPSMLIALATPKLSVNRYLTESGGAISYVTATYKDGLVKLLQKHKNQMISASPVDPSTQQTSSTEKKHKSLPHFTSLEQTASGCGLVGMQGTSLYVYRSLATREGPVQLPTNHIALLLEYCIFTGFDWWDILLSVRQGIVEGLCQRLTEVFHKQPQSTQELLYTRFMSVKLSLYQSSTVSQLKAADCQAKLMLTGIAQAFHRILRPKTVAAQDKSPSERLAAVCNKNKETDVDKIIPSLEMSNEFIVDQVVLQSIQHLMQWVTTFCLHLLTVVPHFQSYSSFPGSTIVRDPSCLGLLRELLVIMRIWSVISTSCQPTFVTTTDVDCLLHLFKLITKAWTCCKDGMEFDDSLIDECCSLPSKIYIPSLDESFGHNNRCESIFTQPQPLTFNLSEEPEFVHVTLPPLVSLPDMVVETRQKHDIIRHTRLGVQFAEPVKQCCRCGCVTQLQTSAKVAILKAWEQGWTRLCFCGGQWKLLED